MTPPDTATSRNEADPRWIVTRHSGRYDGSWRVLYEGQDEKKARSVFTRTRDALRQGGVRLIHNGIELVESVWAPRLRTRW